MSEPSNLWDAEEDPFTQEVFDIVNVVEAIDSCKSACTLMSLTVQSLFLRASEIVSDHVLKMVDYLAFSETWELNEVTTEVPGFICIAKAKRPNARAAGVAVFQNSSATTTAVSHSIRKFCARNDVELDRSDEYGDICLAEITITDKRALLFCLYISPDFTIKQKKFFLARNLFMYSEDDMPMIVTGNFNIDLSREESFQFVDFMRKYLRLELASDPTKATNRGGSCVDLTFIRNIRLDNAPSADVLTIKKVDLCIEENGKLHHTKRFELMNRDGLNGPLPQLVIRRGEAFRLRLHCDRPFDRSRDAMSLIFTVDGDERPTHGHGSLVGVALQQYRHLIEDPLEWGAAIDFISGDVLEILVKPAATAAVTKWKLDFDTKLLSEGFGKSYSLPQPFYLLFNPWCKDDQVYLEEKPLRDECVMNDTTLIWRGSYNRLRPSVWKFGQFEKHILDCSLLLIDKIGKVSATHRGDPIRVCRAISAAVNSPDDDGALLGNWSGDFSGGTAPTKWVGSVEIMQQYYKKQKPVKFGQCWVFAGVVSTIARAIGIPSRVITNYSSAHDTQASLTVDYFVDSKGKIMEELNSDSIWNYHVWNEVWMQRPDLGISSDGDYGGWQAIDATPQEISDGMFRCGPASVLAVKLGEIAKPYDNNFLFAEVNADKVFWRYTGPAHPLKLIRKDVLGIGHFISTKAVGKWVREDITSSYKFAEKTQEERDTMLKALKQTNSAFSRYYLNEDFNEIYFNFELRDDIKIGESFSVILQVKNRSSETTHIVNGSLNVETILYTGKERDMVKTEAFSIALNPSSEEFVRLVVTFDEYFKKLRDQAAFNISCLATVEQTDYEFFAQDDFRVRKPDIKIKLSDTPVSQSPVDVTVSLLNPLPIALRKGIFHIEGSGIEKPLIFKHSEIAVGETISNTFSLTPEFAGRATIAAKFTSKELDDVDGFLAFEAKPRPEDVLMETTENAIIARTDVID